jgi:hypothetical protein
MAILFAYFFCCSLVVIALFGIALYVAAADNRRLRAKLAVVTETPVVVALRMIEAMGLDSTNYGRN